MTVADTVTTDPGFIASTQFERMERAWNDADGAAFGSVFADDTDFVNIRGEHHRGDGAFVGRAHQGLFDSVYAGSTVHYHPEVARLIAPGCVVAVAGATLVAPTGPLQGTNHSRITATIIETDGRWMVTAFQNTLVREAT
ncbi:MAG TPA: SgcJ/EcaC family oxidoreductase [Ilumatobacteraceae bacterium]|nr:SgcJ/EcaC family oxidoreductase [Ilumatobacteraceae bacterium]